MNNRDNWLYDLEGENESPTPPDTPHAYENIPAPLSNVVSPSSVVHVVPLTNYTGAIDTLRIKVVSLEESSPSYMWISKASWM